MSRVAKAFTLVELLIVIIVIAVVAGVAIPKFADSSTRAKEAALKAKLKITRDAIERFHSDTGLYPSAMPSLWATSASANGINAGGTTVALIANRWHGPYLDGDPGPDPIAGVPLEFEDVSPEVGIVRSVATGVSTKGILYTEF